jgi:glycosyltransferase involved in cell wall biosynthesis
VVAILTKNEMANVRACVESVVDSVERVYVVDSGSADGTCAEAESAGAEVLQRRQSGAFDIVEQRNWTLQNVLSSSGWVLFLDADERATFEFLDEVDDFLRQRSVAFDAAMAAPMFMYQGTWLRRFMGFPNWHPRLVHAQRAWLEGRVWESINQAARVARIESPYIHLANSKGLSDWVERHCRYAEEEARLGSGGGEQVARVRRGWLRLMATLLGCWRPLAVLSYHLIWRGGIFDGGSVWSYARRQLVYQLMIVEARRERDRDAKELAR